MDVREGLPQQEVGEAGTMADTDWKQRDFLSGTIFFFRSPRHLSTHMSPITHKHSQRRTQRCRRPHHLSSSSAPFSHPFLFYLKVLEKTAASVYVPHLSRFCPYLFLLLYSGIVGVQIVWFFTPPLPIVGRVIGRHALQRLSSNRRRWTLQRGGLFLYLT